MAWPAYQVGVSRLVGDSDPAKDVPDSFFWIEHNETGKMVAHTSRLNLAESMMDALFHSADEFTLWLRTLNRNGQSVDTRKGKAGGES